MNPYNKIYIVYETHLHDEPYVDKVFRLKQDAQDYVDLVNEKDMRYSFHIEEMELR